MANVDELVMKVRELSLPELNQFSAQLPAKEREAIASKIASEALAGPADRTRDKLWLIVVSAFAIVLVGAFGTLAFGLFFAPTAISPELILSMFTSVVGFLAGLFVPSPVAAEKSGGR